MRYFEYYTKGKEEVFERRHLVTAEEIMEFGERWDPQPFHTDPLAAEKSVFGGLVASATHLFSITCGLLTKVPEDKRGALVSGLGFTNMKLLAPARSGDELKAKGVVLESRVSKSRPEVGVVRFYNELINHKNEVVFSYESAALVVRQT